MNAIIENVEFIEKLKQYALIKKQISELEDKAAELNPEILEVMITGSVKEIPTDLGFFTTVERRTWKYPETVETIKASYDEAKKQAEQLGTATYKVTNSLRFSTTKPKEQE